jgi:energy-coupling factor transporter ATP-binding protein EcfA2
MRSIYLPYKAEIENFKSIKRINFELGDLTILIGPPGSGKSNILDALAIAGYVNRFRFLDKEYGNNGTNLEPPYIIGRYLEIYQLFRYSDLTNPIKIHFSGDVDFNYEISYVSGAPRIVINEKMLNWDLKTLRSDPMSEIQSLVRTLPILETRLYGFDRYSLSTTYCAPNFCGLQLRLSNLSNARSFPASILSEIGWNAPYIIRRHREVISEIDDFLAKNLGMNIEIVVRKTGEMLILDNKTEVDAVGVSESIFRMIYNVLALRSSLFYTKLYGLEKKFFILLEEPEAHIFPYFLDILTDEIVKAIENVNMIITTHNPLFASKLCDKIKNLKIYYVHRNYEGFTDVKELDIEKLAEDVVSIEEIMFKNPSEILRKYAVEVSKHEKRSYGAG